MEIRPLRVRRSFVRFAMGLRTNLVALAFGSKTAITAFSVARKPLIEKGRSSRLVTVRLLQPAFG